MKNDPSHPAAGKTILVPPSEGRVLHAFGDAVQVKLDGTQTGNTLAVCLSTVPPRFSPPPHIHGAEEEMFLVVEGTYQFMNAEGEWSAPMGPGALAYTPRGVRHAFRNAGDTPGRAWIIVTPSGFERFFAECAEVFAAAAQEGGPPDMARIIGISDAHDVEYVPPLGGA